MSNFDTIRTDIEAYLVANWATTTIQFSNAKFTTPAAEWVRCQVVFGDTSQVSMGSSQDHRTELLVVLSLFGKNNSGTGQLLTYADTLTDLFVNKDIGVVKTRSPSINVIGEVDGFYQINLVVPAYSDKVV